jgi:hypothetical protein
VAEQNRAEDRRREARAGRACSPRFDQIGPTMARFDVTQSGSLLQKLNNVDKHRGCNFTLAYSQETRYRVHTNDGKFVDAGFLNALYLGDIHTLPLLIKRDLLIPTVRVEASGTAILFFQDLEAARGMPVPEVLRLCLNHVEQRVIAPLKPFFTPTGG